jgi:ribosomal-protein-alanine N-acetyltransferase
MTSSSSAPVELITERLVLRLWSPAEVAAVIDNTASPFWADGFPAEGDRVIAALFEQNPGWLDERYGQRLITERDTGLVVGSIGLFRPTVEGTLEIGYGIAASRRGRGYATEATGVFARFALTAPGVHTVFADAEPANAASVRVLEKAGFRRWSAEGDTVRFRITGSDHRGG